MHSMLVTFDTTASLDELAGFASDLAHAVTSVPGLISKTWLADGDTIGGFYLFADENTCNAYLAGDIIDAIRGNAAFTNFRVRHFDVLEQLSAMNGTPTEPLRGR